MDKEKAKNREMTITLVILLLILISIFTFESMMNDRTDKLCQSKGYQGTIRKVGNWMGNYECYNKNETTQEITIKTFSRG